MLQQFVLRAQGQSIISGVFLLSYTVSCVNSSTLPLIIPPLSEDLSPDSLLSSVHLVVLLLQFQLFCLQLQNPDLFTGRATLSQTCCFLLSFSTKPAVSNSECSAMKSQMTFNPEVLTCCILYNHCDYYYFTLLVIYEHLNILAMFCYNLPRHSQKRTGYPSEPGSSLGFFLGFGLSREFILSHHASTPALLAVWGFRLGFCTAL